jgi:hypothetical protein
LTLQSHDHQNKENYSIALVANVPNLDPLTSRASLYYQYRDNYIAARCARISIYQTQSNARLVFTVSILLLLPKFGFLCCQVNLSSPSVPEGRRHADSPRFVFLQPSVPLSIERVKDVRLMNFVYSCRSGVPIIRARALWLRHTRACPPDDLWTIHPRPLMLAPSLSPNWTVKQDQHCSRFCGNGPFCDQCISRQLCRASKSLPFVRVPLFTCFLSLTIVGRRLLQPGRRSSL